MLARRSPSPLIAGAVLSVVLLTGCSRDPHLGQPAPDLVTANGTWIYLHGHTLALSDANAMEEYLVTSLDGQDGFRRPDMQGCLSDAIMGIFTADQLSAVEGAHIAGVQYGDILKVATYDDPWASAFVHEEAHWLQECVHGITDPQHRIDPLVWSVVNARGHGLTR